MPTGPTARAYPALNAAYAHFNKTLFGGRLPGCLITLQRKAGARAFLYRGTSGPRRFQAARTPRARRYAVGPIRCRVGENRPARAAGSRDRQSGTHRAQTTNMVGLEVRADTTGHRRRLKADKCQAFPSAWLHERSA